MKDGVVVMGNSNCTLECHNTDKFVCSQNWENKLVLRILLGKSYLTIYENNLIKYNTQIIFNRIYCGFQYMQTLKFKAQLMIGFFPAINQNYGDIQQTLKQKKQNGLKSMYVTF